METEFKQLEKLLSDLEAISKEQVMHPQRYLSLEIAAKALHFIYSNHHLKAFTDYLLNLDAPLTPEEKEFLKKNNIEE